MDIRKLVQERMAEPPDSFGRLVEKWGHGEGYKTFDHSLPSGPNAVKFLGRNLTYAYSSADWGKGSDKIDRSRLHVRQLSVNELSKMADVPSGTLYDFLKGGSIGLDALGRILDALELTVTPIRPDTAMRCLWPNERSRSGRKKSTKKARKT